MNKSEVGYFLNQANSARTGPPQAGPHVMATKAGYFWGATEKRIALIWLFPL